MLNPIVAYSIPVVLAITIGYAMSMLLKMTLAWRLLLFQLCLALVAEITGAIIDHYFHQIKNNFLFNIYILCELSLVLLFINYVLITSPFKNLLVFSFVVGASSWLYMALKFGIEAFFVYVFIGYCILLTASNLVLLIYISLNYSKKIFKAPIFWVLSAHIIYFGGDIPLFTMIDYLVTHKNAQLGQDIYIINNLLAVIRYLFILMSFILYKRSLPNSKVIWSI